ncbi:MAG: glutamate-5-semialdehyde dehydrogenase [Victivallales bacterium]|nr:glutamate-5-semialdehyde dehydrogenase [Victivallales bacterium]
MSQGKISVEEMNARLLEMGEKAKYASYRLAGMSPARKNACLMAMADAIEAAAAEIRDANALDLDAGRKKGLSAAMLDRLTLDDRRIKGMADGLRYVTTLDDPVGKTLSDIIRPNGIRIRKVSVPIGVIGIIYESRPNVTVDAAGLCLKAGNAVILRGGSEAINSNLVLAQCLNCAGVEAGMPDGAVQLVPWTDRKAVSLLLKMSAYIDLIIPRGGEGLIRTVVEQSTIPVIKHYKGVCHVFVDNEADRDMADRIIINAKCQRPGVCNAIEKVLVHQDIADEYVPHLVQLLRDNGVEVRGGPDVCRLVDDIKPATEEDWSAEYLDLILTLKIVGDVNMAIGHINKYGSHHSDCIVTNNAAAAETFLNGVDSATVYHNASTRFTDGGEFGMGAEIGISTDKLHARGPMGLPELTSYKYLVCGEGQVRS